MPKKVQAVPEQNHQKKTKHKLKEKKKRLKKKQQFAYDQEQINSMQNMPKNWNYIRNKNIKKK